MTSTSKSVPVGTVVPVPDGFIQRPDGTLTGPTTNYTLTQPGEYRIGTDTVRATEGE